MTLPVVSKHVVSQQGVSISVTGIAQVGLQDPCSVFPPCKNTATHFSPLNPPPPPARGFNPFPSGKSHPTRTGGLTPPPRKNLVLTHWRFPPLSLRENPVLGLGKNPSPMGESHCPTVRESRLFLRGRIPRFLRGRIPPFIRGRIPCFPLPENLSFPCV